MSSIRVWFNQAFRGTYQLVQGLRDEGEQDGLTLFVVGTHTTASTPFLQACDLALPERDDLTGDAWVEHALAFCREHRIDVLVPGRERLAVAKAQDRFERAGVRVMVNRPEALALLDDKQATYRWALAAGVPVPLTHVVDDAAGFRAAYDDLTAQGLSVCLKPATDHGARGFRVLDETAGSWADLTQPPDVRVHPDRVEAMLAEAGRVPPLLVSEHLTGDELSVDVLCDDGEVLAAVPRSKSGPTWTRRLVEDLPSLEIAGTVVKQLGLRYLVSVDVRYAGEGGDSTARLLEVNTRAASGLFHSRAAGPDLAYAALRLLLDGRVDPLAITLGATVLTYTEAMPVTLPWDA